VQAFDAVDQLVYECGVYDGASGELFADTELVVYETKLGISPGLAATISQTPGPSFHFVLNDSVYKDNRIPPRGFTNSAFETFGGAPVDPDFTGPGDRYVDGQNWDTSAYHLPPTAAKVITTLYYQTISKEYAEFLRDENQSNTAGQELYDLWTAHDRSAPVAMVRDTTLTTVIGVPDVVAGVARPLLAPIANPFRGGLVMRLDLGTPAAVAMTVFDVQGRQVAAVPFGVLGGGAHRLGWDGGDGSGRDAGAGVFFIRVQAGSHTMVERVVRLR
jgi:hypothetical protein